MRWKVRVFTNAVIGNDDEPHARPVELFEQFEVEELEELQDKIERGADWRIIDKIEVRYQGGSQ